MFARLRNAGAGEVVRSGFGDEASAKASPLLGLARNTCGVAGAKVIGGRSERRLGAEDEAQPMAPLKVSLSVLKCVGRLRKGR